MRSGGPSGGATRTCPVWDRSFPSCTLGSCEEEGMEADSKYVQLCLPSEAVTPLLRSMCVDFMAWF